MIGRSKMNERLPDMTQSEMWLDVSELQEKMKKKIQQTSNFDQIEMHTVDRGRLKHKK